MAQLLREYLRLHLIGPRGSLTAGVPLVVNGSPMLVYVKLTHMLGDGDGFRLAFSWRGASSLKPCFRHRNVWKLGSGLAHRRDDQVEITCTDPSKFECRTAGELEDLADLLVVANAQCRDGLLTKRKLEEMQKAAGLNASPEGFMADHELRRYVQPTEIMVTGWVHSCLQDGLLNVEVHCFLKAAGVQSSRLESYFKSDWHFPFVFRKHGRALHHMFNSFRARSNTAADKFKISASDLLLCYGLVRHFVETRIEESPDLALNRAAFFAACEVVDTILMAKRGRKPLGEAAAELRDAVSRCIALHIAAYGEEDIKPKHHWVYDVADWMERNKDKQLVLDEFIVERLHLRFRDIAHRVDNPKNWEASVLAAAFNVQKTSLQHGKLACGLEGGAPLIGGATAVSKGLTDHAGQHVVIGDIVLLDGVRAGEVMACALECGTLFVVVRPFAFKAKVSSHSGAWLMTEDRVEVWRASDVGLALAWYMHRGDTVVIRC